MADELADTYATAPKQCHIKSSPVAIYFNGYYIANDYQHKLRSITLFKQAKQYMRDKYNWNDKTFNDVD